MKSLATSAALHTALLTAMLVSFGSPRPLDMTQGEAMPVSVVPIEEYSQVVQGEADAEMADTPAPTPTEAPERLPMPAENIGNNEVDLESAPQPEAAPRETVQTATAEAPPPEAPPQPAEEAPPPAEEPAPAPQPETPAEAEPEPEPAPVEEAAVEPAPQLPQNVPLPQVRPQPPRPPETPRPQPTRTAEAQPKPRETANDTREREFDADEIAALLNREQSAGGGARRSQQQAALGGTHTTGARLSQSEYDALRGQVSRCWSPPSGVSDAGSLRVSLRLQLDQSGQLIGLPEIIEGGSGSTAQRVAAEAAVRAVRRCAPYSLPAEKYDTWKDVTFNFDPSQMF